MWCMRDNHHAPQLLSSSIQSYRRSTSPSISILFRMSQTCEKDPTALFRFTWVESGALVYDKEEERRIETSVFQRLVTSISISLSLVSFNQPPSLSQTNNRKAKYQRLQQFTLGDSKHSQIAGMWESSHYHMHSHIRSENTTAFDSLLKQTLKNQRMVNGSRNMVMNMPNGKKSVIKVEKNGKLFVWMRGC